jgi:hypothetical protein
LNFDYYYGAMGIAASKEDNQSLILKNGYVSAFGAVAIMPTPLLSNVIAVACGNSYQNMALHGDGRVTHWSLNTVQTLPPGITNIAAISMAGTHKMVLPHGAYAGPTMSAISASKDGDWFSVQVPTARGKNYYLQYRDTTRNSQWQMAMLFPGPLPGNDKLRTFTDYSGGSTERYYRVWQKP